MPRVAPARRYPAAVPSRRRTPVVTVVAAAFALAIPTAACAKVSVHAAPGIRPRFQLGVRDYVSRCKPGQPLRFTISASKGDAVAVGDGPKRGGDFTTDVRLKTDAAINVRVTANGRDSAHHVRCLPLDFPRWTAHRHG